MLCTSGKRPKRHTLASVCVLRLGSSQARASGFGAQLQDLAPYLTWSPLVFETSKSIPLHKKRKGQNSGSPCLWGKGPLGKKTLRSARSATWPSSCSALGSRCPSPWAPQNASRSSAWPRPELPGGFGATRDNNGGASAGHKRLWAGEAGNMIWIPQDGMQTGWCGFVFGWLAPSNERTTKIPRAKKSTRLESKCLEAPFWPDPRMQDEKCK